MTPLDANWKYPHTAYEIAAALYADKSRDYEEFAQMLRENFVSIEDRLALIEDQIATLWATVFP